MDMDELGFFLFMEEQERKKREQEEREIAEQESEEVKEKSEDGTTANNH